MRLTTEDAIGLAKEAESFAKQIRARADDVAHDEADGAVLELDDVVPVTADVDTDASGTKERRGSSDIR